MVYYIPNLGPLKETNLWAISRWFLRNFLYRWVFLIELKGVYFCPSQRKLNGTRWKSKKLEEIKSSFP